MKRQLCMHLAHGAILLLAPFGFAAADSPITTQLVYTSELWTAASGGQSNDLRYLDNIDLIIDADLEEGLGWRGTSMRLYGLYNNGKSFTRLVGDAQVASSIETGVQAAIVYEAWVQQAFGQGSLKVGLMEMNFDFDVLESANLFVHAAHGLGTVLGLSGRNGPSTFPLTSLGARLEYSVSDALTVRAAVYDGVPGDPDRLTATAIKLGDGDGALIMAEAEVAIPEGKVLLGHWRYTAEFDRLDGTLGGGNNGFYLRAESRLLKRGSGAGLDGFIRLGAGDGQINAYNRFIGAGLVYTAPFTKRYNDQVGLAVAAAFSSSTFKQVTAARPAEWNVELTYRLQLNEHFALQPAIQYIFNPAADTALADVLALGLRAQIGTQW